VREASHQSALAAVAQASNRKSKENKGINSRRISLTSACMSKTPVNTSTTAIDSSPLHRPCETAVTDPVAWWRYLCLRVIVEESISYTPISPEQLAVRCRAEYDRLLKQRNVQSVVTSPPSSTGDTMETCNTTPDPIDSDETQSVCSSDPPTQVRLIQYSPNGGRVDGSRGQLRDKENKDVHLWNDFVQQDEIEEFALCIEAQLDDESEVAKERGQSDDESDRDNGNDRADDEDDSSEKCSEKLVRVCEGAQSSHLGEDSEGDDINEPTSSSIPTEYISIERVKIDEVESSHEAVINNDYTSIDESNESIKLDEPDYDTNDNDKDDEDECIFQINSIFKNSLAEERQYTEEVGFCPTKSFSSPPTHNSRSSNINSDSSTCSDDLTSAEGHANFFANPFASLLENRYDDVETRDDNGDGECSDRSVSLADTTDHEEVKDTCDHQNEDCILENHDDCSPVAYENDNEVVVEQSVDKATTDELPGMVTQGEVHEDTIGGCNIDNDGNDDNSNDSSGVKSGEFNVVDDVIDDYKVNDKNDNDEVNDEKNTDIVQNDGFDSGTLNSHDEVDFEAVDSGCRRSSARFLVAFSKKYVSDSSDDEESEVIKGEFVRVEADDEHQASPIGKYTLEKSENCGNVNISSCRVSENVSDRDDESSMRNDEGVEDEDVDGDDRTHAVKAWAPVKVLDIDSESDDSDSESDEGAVLLKFHREGMIYVGSDSTSNSTNNSTSGSGRGSGSRTGSTSDNEDEGVTQPRQSVSHGDSSVGRNKPLPLITLSSGNHMSSVLINQYPTHLRGNMACRRESTSAPATAISTAPATSTRTRLPPSAKLYSRQPAPQQYPSNDCRSDSNRNYNAGQSTLRSTDHAKAILDML